MSKKVFFLYENDDYAVDGMRSCLGLAVENMYSFGAVLCPLPKLDDHAIENIDWVRDMEGDVMSTIPFNVEENSMTATTLEEIGMKMREMEIIVPFGIY